LFRDPAKVRERAGHTQEALAAKIETTRSAANEFAGRLLVPERRLQACFNEFAPETEKLAEKGSVPLFHINGRRGVG